MNAQRQILVIITLLFAVGTQAAPTLLQSSDLTPVLNVGDRIVLSAKFTQAQAVRWTVNGDVVQTDRNRRRGRAMLNRFAFSAESAGVTAVRASAVDRDGETTVVDWQITAASAAREGAVTMQVERSPQDDVQLAEGDSQTFSVSAQGGMPPYQYAWLLGADPVGTASSFGYQPGFDTVAHPARERTLSLACTVVDSLGEELTAIWAVTVTDVDRAPPTPIISVVPGQPKTTHDLGLSTTQSGDLDGDAISYDVTWHAVAARSTFVGETLAAENTSRDERWEARILVVTNPYDDVPQTHGNPITVATTIANSAPVAESAEVDVLQSESRLLILPGSDADNTAIHFDIVRHPDFGELRDLDAAAGHVNYLADPRATGRTVIRYRVTDDRGASAVGMLTLNVTGWTLPIEVSGAEELMLGMARTAQSEQAPPEVSTTLGERLMRDVREEADDAIWELVVEGDVLVKWNVDHVPDTGLFLTPIDGPGQSGNPAETMNMAQVNSIQNPGRYRIRHAIFEYDIELRTGWQLLGFPFDPLDEDVTLGGQVQEMLSWGEDYTHAQRLGAHGGYFAFVPGGGATVRLAGRHQRKMAGTLQNGWNLVSLALPPGTREISYAQFLAEYPQASKVAWELKDGQYRRAQVLRKGVSYWVYVEADLSGLGPLSFEELPEDRAPAIAGALEGGVTGTTEDTAEHNSVPEDEQLTQDIFEVPTNGPPSPLFGAEAFTQKMLRFEEFGTDDLDLEAQKPQGWAQLPPPLSTDDVPPGPAVESFLTQPIWPVPTTYSNITDRNPWEPIIESYLGRDLAHPPAEGRPPGIGWAHQRWDEFTPQRYFQTATTGARLNGGFRDAGQKHGYTAGEFGPGGLYHNTAGTPGFEGTTSGLEVRLHPSMPVQAPEAVWTFDGTFPPKLLNVRYGEPTLMRHYNALPVDVAANRGFGLHTLTTHEHNGHSPAESDGYANAFFFPGQFYDYRWPIALAGHDSINTRATDRRAGAPDGNGGIRRVPGDYRETMSTHWFHDHMLDFTAQNVYKGSAAMMNYYSAIDRGNESIDDGVNLRLPSGSDLDWGNRDYDVNLLLADKAWDNEGQLWFNPFNLRGFIGDVMTVNWLFKPYLDVRSRRYRFRLLNGSVSRYFKVALIDEAGDPVPFHMVCNDGNIMEHSVYFPDGELPTQGIAERYDIVVDFSNFAPGSKLYFVNLLQHKDGQSTDVVIPREDIVSGAYAARLENDAWVDGDPVVGSFLEFRVHNYDGVDQSMDPADYVEGLEQMIPLRRPTQHELDTAKHRSFEFERQPTDEAPWVIETDGGKGYNMDPQRLSAAPTRDNHGLEVWRLVNSGTWSHPIHIHFEEGIILRRNGVEPPEWEKWARKDVYRLGPQPDSGDVIEIALRFREFAGTYMEHCHNTQHEDHAMLLRWDIENPGQVKLMPTPIPSWDGVGYVDSVALPTARTGDAVGEFGPDLDEDAVEIWVEGTIVEQIDLVNMEIGDALNPSEDERAVANMPLTVATNIDDEGNERTVYFILHDISDQKLADKYGAAWAGALTETPLAATSLAAFDSSGWTFYGDLPNPVKRQNAAWQHLDDPAIPAQSAENEYSPLRQVTIDGQDVIANCIFIQWGNESWEHLRIDVNCDPEVAGTFPDDPPNTSCRYNGDNWGGDTGHALEINVTDPQPYVKMKLHKSWAEDGDYVPYYIVVDSWPAGTANNMGVVYVPKHQHLGTTAVSLVQFLPPTPLSGSYPPTGEHPHHLAGGGPLGGQIGLPTYFMPEDDYSPMWHIGFAHWIDDTAVKVLKGIEELKYLRGEGKLMIHEWPGIRVGENDYDFDNPTPPHVVNCPVPVTIDSAVHRANKMLKAAAAAAQQ